MEKIRRSVFETNSSSTHSIAIVPEGWVYYGDHNNFECDSDSPYIPVMVTQPLNVTYESKTCVIETSNYYKRDSYYFYISGDMQKIQFLVSSLSSMISVFNLDLEKHQLPYFKQVTNAIRDYLKEKYGIHYIKVVEKETYYETRFLDELIGYGWKGSRNKYKEQEVYDIVKKVISDDRIVFTCHSDETGPYPEEIDLIPIEDLKNLIKEEK